MTEHNLWPRVFKTLVEMLHDRGMKFKHKPKNIFEPEHKYVLKYTEGSNKGRKCLLYIAESQVGKTDMEDYIEDMVESGIHSCILILAGEPKSISDHAKKIIHLSNSGKKKEVKEVKLKSNKHSLCSFEVFHKDELVSNITKHQFNPKFRGLNDDEKKALLERFRCSEKQFPVMSVTDPIARYYNYKLGTIVEITRENNYVTYRCVGNVR